ncbi:MAG: GntR family transcriptional regulator [Clostridia bacterium]|nr:GntR family transcriptional regulator [Lachnospiraceae bacterium]NCC00592.1 GntR family transcriptional regulator [Clostridia bacterium]NCD02020.1 GntR family transcriptional regulator [Clostridia bacterium]
MAWELNSGQPIYTQIVERVMIDIVSGRYTPGEKLPSVRELAGIAAVNPNTMQKALSALEQSGLVYSQRTSGRFITEDSIMIEKAKKDLAASQIKEFMEKMKQLGITKEEAIELIQEKGDEA